MVIRTNAPRPFRPYRKDLPRADVPMAGFYRIRLVKAGPWVPVRIWFGPPRDPLTAELLDRSPRWQAVRSAMELPVWNVWPDCSGQPITEAEYNKLISDPPSDPLMPINLATMTPVF